MRDLEVIVTVNGKPKAIMIKADEDLEFLIKAISRAKAELAVESITRVLKCTLSCCPSEQEDLEREIAESRKEE